MKYNYIFFGILFFFIFAAKAMEKEKAQPSRHQITIECLAGQDITSCTNILDIGCRNTNLLKYVAAQAKKAQVTAIDPSERIIQRASEQLRNYPHVKFIVGNPTASSGATGQFDLIMADDFFGFVKDKKEALALVSQALKPDGLVLATTTRKSIQFLEAFRECANVGRWQNILQGFDLAEHYNPFQKETAAQLFTNAGLTPVSVTQKLTTFDDIDDCADALRDSIDGLPVVSQLPSVSKEIFLQCLISRYREKTHHEDGPILYGPQVTILAKK